MPRFESDCFVLGASDKYLNKILLSRTLYETISQTNCGHFSVSGENNKPRQKEFRLEEKSHNDVRMMWVKSGTGN